MRLFERRRTSRPGLLLSPLQGIGVLGDSLVTFPPEDRVGSSQQHRGHHRWPQVFTGWAKASVLPLQEDPAPSTLLDR